jgi:hypothetical protein
MVVYDSSLKIGWLGDALPWLELYFTLHIVKTASLDAELISNLQFVTKKRSSSHLLYHLFVNGFFNAFKTELASSKYVTNKL